MYGFCIMFAAAFPLAPLVIIGFTLVTLWVNGTKIMYTIRRPFFSSQEDLGVWIVILRILTVAGVITNASE